MTEQAPRPAPVQQPTRKSVGWQRRFPELTFVPQEQVAAVPDEPAAKPAHIQQPGWKVPAARAYKGDGGKPGLPPGLWAPIDYAPKVSLQKKIRKVLKDDGDPTPDTAMQVVDKVLASIKPADRDEALRTALLICVLQVLHPPRGRPGGQPKAW